MLKSNKGKGQQHINVLRSSSMDVISLGDAVHHRFVSVLADHLRLTHEEIFLPPELDSDVQLWRTMMVRHNSKDFRNTEDEFRAMTRIADWTLKVKARLTNTEVKLVDWDVP